VIATVGIVKEEVVSRLPLKVRNLLSPKLSARVRRKMKPLRSRLEA